MAKASTRPPSQYQRNAFAPSIIAATACLVGIALIGHEYYLGVRFVIAILALIIGWFALQARQWWWVPVMLAIAVVWNPLYPFPFAGTYWEGAHILAAATFLTAGATIKTLREPAAE